MTADRDPQVGALLDLLEPAPPRPGFWDDLEDRLRSEPSPVVALARVPGAATSQAAAARRRRVVVGLAAAVVAVAALMGSLALRDDRERTDTVPMQPDTSTPQSLPGAPTPGATIAADSPAAIALQGADLWLQSVIDDDRELGWALLGQQSRDQLGSEAAYRALDLQTAWSSYVDSPDRSELVLPLGGDLWAVVLTVTSEADLVPPKVLVVQAPPASEYTVEVLLPGPALGLIGTDLGGEPLPQESTIPIAVDAEASRFLVIVDGSAFDGTTSDGPEDNDHLPWLERDADGDVIGVRPQPALEVGVHWIAVLQIVDGALAADARLFEITSGR